MSAIQDATGRWAPPTDKPDALYEFVDGEWRETPRLGAFSNLIASTLCAQLGLFARQHRLGLALNETLFRLTPVGNARRPDVAFVSFDRWPYATPPQEDPPAFDIVPNLAVEVISPTNGHNEILRKVQEYFFHGVQLVWVISPQLRLVQVHESPEQTRTLGINGELTAGEVLPGFRLPLTALFSVGGKPA